MDKSYREELEDWCAMWEKACEDNFFASTPEPSVQDEELSEMDSYYSQLFSESDDNIPNAVHPDTKGPDCCVHDTPWVDEDSIEAVCELKKQLYEIECELIAKESGGEKWNEKPVVVEDKKLAKKIETIKSKIDKLSDKLGLGFKDSK